MHELPARASLALLPTPLQRADRLSASWGGPTIWIKRDDLTGFGISGNKVRKLEFHVAAAEAADASTLITCGALQSNHCRATALVAARLGLDCHLVLRTPGGAPPDTVEGNYLLDRLAGASIEYVDADGYEHCDAVMADAALHIKGHGSTGWIIPEGASDVVGMWGHVLAMRELADQLTMLPRPPSAVWHPASSGGTTAGIGWALDRLGLEIPLVASSVGESSSELTDRIDGIWRQAAELTAGTVPVPTLDVIDRHIGLGYGLATKAELATQVEATSLTGQFFDPTYTGKVLHGLREEIRNGRYEADDHIVFWHTGGGFAVFAHDFGSVLGG